ncbi:hypothetical protein R1sor_024493 [Riccia sorocarpa]|uniref:Uncharacterized protein n=1 Tax=Riccia sorocarpa TaxID=122646 RepID=A0ABD3GSX4_9MARC
MANTLWLCTVALLSTVCRGATPSPAYVTFPGPEGATLSGILYTPGPDFFSPQSCSYPGMVLMHGCTGIWSNRRVNRTVRGTWDLQNHLEKWALKLAARRIVALVVDSFTSRVPPNLPASSEEWQNQCTGSTFSNRVSPYTTRVQDARAAWRYLESLSNVMPNRIGLLGWSQGAEATMTEAGATLHDTNQIRDDYLFAVMVGFYPGCGDHLEFGGVVSSFWRPYTGFMLNVGTEDAFYTNCKSRVETSNRNHPSAAIQFPQYNLAGHSFDHKSEIWPSSKCAMPVVPSNADECAMRAADIDSLAFIESFLFAPIADVWIEGHDEL